MLSNETATEARKVFGSLISMYAILAVRSLLELGIQDILNDKKMSVTELAKISKTNPDALSRLLRVVCQTGLLKEHERGYFSLTPTGAFLRSDNPASIAPAIKLIIRPFHWNSWLRLTDAVREGRSAFEIEHGERMFTWLAHEKDEGKIFDDWMTRSTELQLPGLMSSYDYGWAKTIVDIGGGHGMWLSAILDKYPNVHTILFDMPSVVEHVKTTDQRMKVVGGDFFKEVPKGNDLYLLKFILHDWLDDACISILKACRNAMHPKSKLILAEMIMPEDGSPSPAYFMDLNMLVLNYGGKERTMNEFKELCTKAGLRLDKVIPTSVGMTFMEVVLT